MALICTPQPPNPFNPFGLKLTYHYSFTNGQWILSNNSPHRPAASTWLSRFGTPAPAPYASLRRAWQAHIAQFWQDSISSSDKALWEAVASTFNPQPNWHGVSTNYTGFEFFCHAIAPYIGLTNTIDTTGTLQHVPLDAIYAALSPTFVEAAVPPLTTLTLLEATGSLSSATIGIDWELNQLDFGEVVAVEIFVGYPNRKWWNLRNPQVVLAGMFLADSISGSTDLSQIVLDLWPTFSTFKHLLVGARAWHSGTRGTGFNILHTVWTQ